MIEKNRYLAVMRLLTSVVALSFLACGMAFAATPYGWHDSTNTSTLYGWTCDPDDFNATVTVQVRDQFGVVGQVAANTYRPDVANVGLCGGNSYHGFTFDFVANATRSVYDGQTHTFYAYAIDVNDSSLVLLSGSPQSIAMPANNLPWGWQDSTTANGVSGWSCDGDNVSIALNIRIQDAAGVIGTTTASDYRPDLMGACNGSPYHGFHYSWTQGRNVQDNQTHQISVYAQDPQTGQWALLSGSPQSVYIPVPISVTLNSPAPGVKSAYNYGSSVQLSANASDASGANPTVIFYANGNEITRLYNPPYTTSYTPPPGIYSITVTASGPSGQTSAGTGNIAVHNLVPVVSPAFVTVPTWIYQPPNSALVGYPLNLWYMAVRLTSVDPTQVALSTDFSKYYAGTNPCAGIPLGDGWCELTNFQTAQPYAAYQRGQADSDVNNTSAFQQWGTGAGSFINTFVSGCNAQPGGSAHSAYEYRPSPNAPVFDGDPNTEIVVQADLAVPALYVPGGTTNTSGRAEVGLTLYLTSSDGLQTVAVLAGAYNSFAEDSEGTGYDGHTHYTSTPMDVLPGGTRYLSLSALNAQYQTADFTSARHSTSPWGDQRTFRAYLSRSRFANALADLGVTGYAPEDFRVSSFSTLHEMVVCDSQNNINLSSAMSVANMHVYSARYH